MKIKSLSFVVCVSAFACSPKQEVKTSPDILKQAIGIINKDSTAPPVITFIDKTNAPKTIAAGKPEVVPNPNSDGLGAPNFTNYNTEQGLALSSVTCGYRDKTGNLWFGTSGGGVSQYDGKSFTNFTMTQGLAYDVVYSITEDKTGNLWFGTAGGVSRYDGKSFTIFNTAQGLINNVVTSITKDKAGKLWFGTRGGVSCYNGDSITSFTTADGLANDNITSIKESRTGKLWFGTLGGVSRYDGNSFTNFTTADGLINNRVLSIAEDKKGDLWFGTVGGVSRYDGNSFTNFTTAEGLANNTVRSITEDKTGILWFATDGGVSRYDGNSFTNFATEEGLLADVRSITEDKTGSLWFGMGLRGVSRYDGKSFTSFTTISRMATEDKTGRLWFTKTGGGVSCYDGKSFTNFTTAQGLINNVVNCITEDKTGNLWFGTNGVGVSRYDGKSFTNFTTAQGLASNVINSIREDKTGNLWFATPNRGVSRYDGKSFTNFTSAQGLVDNWVGDITEDKTGNLWFNLSYGAVSRYDGNSFTNFTTAQGQSYNDVWNITVDKKGNLWFGTAGGGVIRYDGQSFFNFTTTQGLANNNVWAIVIDLQENIFIGTNLGFNVLKGFKNLTPNPSSNGEIIPAVNSLVNEELKNYQPVFETYNKETGYPVKDCGPGDLSVDSKGIIWAGQGDKLVRFDYSAILKNTEPPAVFIQAVKIHDENISWSSLIKKRKTNPELDSLIILNDEALTFGRILSNSERDSMRLKFSDIKFDSIRRFYLLPENLVLPYNHNSVTFDFVAIEPARHFLVRYQYILEGYDKEWSPVTNKTTATFGNIREGEYTFKLKARSPDGVWSEPITYTFKVLPPWWRTWWFRLGVIIIIGTIFYTLIRWRMKQKFRKQLEQSEKERQMAELKQKATELEMQALRAQMNPHFIFNSLNSINRFILQNNREQASEYLTKFSKLVRMILQNSAAPLITLESELESLGLYLNLESLRFNYHFDYKISVPKDLDISALQVPPIILQPYVENAIWHGLMHKEEKGQLDIEISEENDHLYFKISDNGIGRKRASELSSKSATKHKSMGLKITAHRIAMMQNANGLESPVTINDLANADGSAAGTEVVIKMPVIYD